MQVLYEMFFHIVGNDGNIPDGPEFHINKKYSSIVSGMLWN